MRRNRYEGIFAEVVATVIVGVIWVCMVAVTGYFASWLFQHSFDAVLSELFGRPMSISMMQAGAVIGFVSLPMCFMLVLTRGVK